MAKFISVTSSKGGVGKSTSTVEIAARLHDKGYRVLVIDLDENCSLSKNIGADVTSIDATSHSALTGAKSVAECVQHHDLFDILVGSKKYADAELEFKGDDDKYRLADLKEIVDDDYDFIFADNAPSRSILLKMIYIASDYVIIPTFCDVSSMDMIHETELDIETLKNNRNHDSHAEVIGYILSNYRASTTMNNIAFSDLQEMAAKYDNPPFVEKVHEAISASAAKTFQTSISRSDKKSSLINIDYDSITDRVLERVGK